jgi:hypothetical protein
MARVVAIPKVGAVQFPDSMSDQDVQNASQAVHEDASRKEIAAIIHYVADRTQSTKVSEHLKVAHTIATVLETFPALADLAGAGLKAQR